MASALKDKLAKGGDDDNLPQAAPSPADRFRLRFRAWWDGRSLADVVNEARLRAEAAGLTETTAGGGPETPAPSPPSDAGELEQAPDPDREHPWTPSRIAINEAVFGPGCMSPGGSARTLDMISAFGLGRDVNVLEIGSRLGGAARAIALECNAWVTGFEPDPVLAAAAMAPERCDQTLSGGSAGRSSASTKVRLADKARIAHADLDTLELKPGLYDGAFARETLHRVSAPARLLEELFIALKPYCPLLLTDYFIAPGKQDHPDLQAWLGRELQPPRLWTVAQAQKAMKEIGFDLRVSEDISAQYRHDLFDDLTRFIAGHEKRGVPAEMVRPLLLLAETWANRVMALDAGLVTIHKFIGLRTGG